MSFYYYFIYNLYYCLFLLIGLLIVYQKFKMAVKTERLKLAYILAGTTLGSMVGFIFCILLLLFNNYRYIWVGPYSSYFFVLPIAYAITKHRLMNIYLAISKTLSILVTAISIGLIYWALAWSYKTFISIEIDLFFVGLTIVFCFIIGITFQTIRLFFQTTTDKAFLRGKYDYYQELEKISAQITQSLSLDNILNTLQRTFYEVIEVSNPRVYLPKDFDKPGVVKLVPIKAPAFMDGDLVLPCLLEDKLIAIIVLGKKLTEDPYTKEDLRLLASLANQTAVALDHHRICEEMLMTQKQLLLADKLSALGKIAAGISHELKNPLAAIKGMTQALAAHPDDLECLNDFKDIVPKEVDRLVNLVDNLAEFGKAPRSQIKQVNINWLIENSLKLFNKRCQDKSISITKNLKPLPEIQADPEQLTQVITNLILNAIQAMPQGGQLRLKTETANNRIVIAVSDTGHGIPKDTLKDIFEPFFSTKEEGMGVGLAISYKIIKNHGGEIKVESQVGKGTTFRVELPEK